MAEGERLRGFRMKDILGEREKKMREQFMRTEMLLGKEAMDRLAASRVAVFGIGGVGGYVCEALARSGVGAFDLIDNDKVCLSNLNRQIIALRSTLGRYKTDVMKERMLEINPDADVRVYHTFFLPENSGEFPFSEYDYIVDAVDTVTAKLELAVKAKENGVPVISSMGTGNKLEGSGFRVTDIGKTRVCPLAKVMRRELKKRGIEHLKVVYSEEIPLAPLAADREGEYPEKGGPFISDKEKPAGRRATPGSCAFVPPVAGMILAGEVVKDLAVDIAQQRENVYNTGVYES